ncbi:MAG: hypothetical protein K6F84_05190, partial [Lachnospiraceae bacterium]|nr:hypothetical protein [Lachnospiraceae bacterium]
MPDNNFPFSDQENFKDNILIDFSKSAAKINTKNAEKLVKLGAAKEKKELIKSTVPDTFGCDKFFANHGFINNLMKNDFIFIAREFLAHEYENAPEYGEIDYFSRSKTLYSSRGVFYNSVVNMMMNAAKKKSPYTIGLFITLYKIYHKEEYNRLKRFKTITDKELKNLCIIRDFNVNAMVKMSRLLFMSRLLGIEVDPSCNFAYNAANDYWAEKKEAAFQYNIHRELLKTCQNEILEKTDIKELENYDKKMKDYLGFALRWFGYDPRYVDKIHFRNYGFSESVVVGLGLLKSAFPNWEYDEKELVFFGTLIRVLSTMDYNTAWFSQFSRFITFGHDPADAFNMKRCLFKPQTLAQTDIPLLTDEPSVFEAKDSKDNPDAENELSNSTLEIIKEYISEIESLRNSLRRAKTDNEVLREELSQQKKLNEGMDDLKEQLALASNELSVLRNYVHSLTEGDVPCDQTDIHEMTEYLKKFKILIIGGHDNWISRLKNLFPDWVYIS